MENQIEAAEAAATSPTFVELCAAYLKEKNNPHSYRKCKHPKSPASHLKAPLAVWGALPIEVFRKGSRMRVQGQVSAWREGGTSMSTCRKRCAIMRAAFRHCVKVELIERGQEPVFDLPPQSPPRERFVDPVTELGPLLREADDVRTADHTRTAFYLLLVTGVRRGALLDLKWEHVDFDKRVIRFRDTEAPGDRSKKRRVDQPMDDLLHRILSEAKERARSEWVIEYNAKRCRTIYPALKRMFARAGLPDLRIHDLRRSSATYVYNGLEGDLARAANHIGDTEKMAEAVYVQKDVAKNLPGIIAVSAMLTRARHAPAAVGETDPGASPSLQETHPRPSLPLR